VSKTILCLCHDVTEEDVRRAVAEGYTEPETIKRYTAAFMGPCQGRWCADLVMEAIADALGRPVSELQATTSRPPAYAVRMGQLAGEGPADPG
jgi:bacterioferritin-associated ferredoxin